MINLDKWSEFKTTEPFKTGVYAKRNWGNKQHSLCSFYGKLKPSIAHHLVKTFSSKGDSVFDCFSGSGTIPFEASLNGRKSFSLDINPISIVLSTAKVKSQSLAGIMQVFEDLKASMIGSTIPINTLNAAQSFGFNKSLIEYYHPSTLSDICKARDFFLRYKNKDANYYFVLSCLLHILHGNRPYALSRRSHSITPYAPSGDFEEKILTDKLYEKMKRSFDAIKSSTFIEGEVFQQDILSPWDDNINNINTIITSPPFFDSTRFYLVHWLRSWFLGWESVDFDLNKPNFIGEKQKKDFSLYTSIFQQSNDRLKLGGSLVLHLGKSKKKDMGAELLKLSKPYFKNAELFIEDVSGLENHGVKDKGSVSSHQYLILY
jgi:hypothetical protein